MLRNEIIDVLLPTIHPKINMEDFNEEGRLFFSESAISAVVRDMQLKGEMRRGTKDYDIIKMNDAHYITYQKNPLGKGSYGQVVLAQNIQTKVLYALKKSAEMDATETLQMLQKEQALLTKMQQAEGEIVFSDDSMEYFNMMRLAHGVELRVLLDGMLMTDRTIPTVSLFQMAYQIVGAISSVHANDLLHRDIKLENLMYDLASDTATPIDFGLAIQAKPTDVVTAEIAGSPGYIAPEIESGRQFSEKSEVYAAGKVLACLFGLATFSEDVKNLSDQIQLVDRESETFKNNTQLPNLKVRSVAHDFLAKMLADDPNNRPLMDATRKFLKEMISEHLFLPAKIKTVGVLDVNEFKNNPAEAEKYIFALRHFDQVCLVDTVKNRDAREYMAIHRQLSDNGIQTTNRLYCGNNIADTIKKIPELASRQDEVAINNYFHVTMQPDNNTKKILKQSNIQTMKVDATRTGKEYAGEIYQYLNKTPIDDRHFHQVQEALKEEIERIQMKHGKNNPTALKRVKAIEDTATLFAEKRDKLTYSALSHQLASLQSRMIAIDTLSQSIKKFLGVKTKVTGQQRIADLDKSIQDNVAGEFSRFKK